MSPIFGGRAGGIGLILCLVSLSGAEVPKQESIEVDARELTIEGRAWPGEGPTYGRLPRRIQGEIRPELWQMAAICIGPVRALYSQWHGNRRPMGSVEYGRKFGQPIGYRPQWYGSVRARRGGVALDRAGLSQAGHETGADPRRGRVAQVSAVSSLARRCQS